MLRVYPIGGGSWAGNLLWFAGSGRKAVDNWPIGMVLWGAFFFGRGFAAGAERAQANDWHQEKRGWIGAPTSAPAMCDEPIAEARRSSCGTINLRRQKARNKKNAGPSRHAQFGRSPQNIECLGKHGPPGEAEMRTVFARGLGINNEHSACRRIQCDDSIEPEKRTQRLRLLSKHKKRPE